MSDRFKVFVVDDDPFVLDIIRGILDPDCEVEIFTSVEQCVPRLDLQQPDMFLLDVRMPGIDGYTFCRQIKDDGGLCKIPVTFVSGHDTIEARLRGYDAGGEDFIVKPFEAEEIRRKVRVAQQIAENQRSLAEQVESAEFLSSLVMASMDEYAILVRFMREMISWETVHEFAEGLLSMLHRYRLEGVVQIRIDKSSMTYSAAGTNLPLETSIMDHVRGMDRIFEFRNRSVHNFERVTLMINNMPLDDAEYCGRLRDHLSIAAECSEARLRAIEIETANRRNQAGIVKALETIRASTAELGTSLHRDRAHSTELMLRMEQSLSKAFVHLGLSDTQERSLAELVNDFMRQMFELMDHGNDFQQALHELGEHLTQLHQGSQG
ncbi:MAG TPA: response regulator [Rhodocyclaceae bacterium]|nr:response regulator [Rhodocyclaceae bacterium]